MHLQVALVIIFHHSNRTVTHTPFIHISPLKVIHFFLTSPMATTSGGLIWLPKGWYPYMPPRLECSLFVSECSTLGSLCVLHHCNHTAFYLCVWWSMFGMNLKQSARQILLLFPSLLLVKLEDKESSNLLEIIQIVGSRAGTAAKMTCLYP